MKLELFVSTKVVNMPERVTSNGPSRTVPEVGIELAQNSTGSSHTSALFMSMLEVQREDGNESFQAFR